MKTAEQINSESRYVIHFRLEQPDEWKIYRHIAGKGYQEAMRMYHKTRDTNLADYYSNMMDLNSGAIVAQSAPQRMYPAKES